VTASGSGRVVYEMDGTPGAFCQLHVTNNIHDPLAIVACRELGYVDGVLMLEEHYRTLNHIKYRSPRYPDRQADNFLGYVKCVGNESKVLECPFKFLSGVDYPSMYDFLEPCDTSTCYRERAYQGIYGRNVNSSCRHKDLSVRCLTAGDQCCYTACRPHENQIYHRTIMYNNVPTCNITT